MTDTYHPTVKPSSSLPMEELEMQENVINLGKKLLTQLNVEEVDEITAWMLQYLAEQICIAEELDDETAKTNCFETILKFWDKNASFPEDVRPFRDFEAIEKAIKSLSPENSQPLLLSTIFDDSNACDGVSMHWLDMINGTEATAKILLTFFLEQACKEAVDDNLREWLETTKELMDTKVIRLIVSTYGKVDKDEERLKVLSERLEKLKTYEATLKVVRESIESEIAQLQE